MYPANHPDILIGSIDQNDEGEIFARDRIESRSNESPIRPQNKLEIVTETNETEKQFNDKALKEAFLKFEGYQGKSRP